MFDFSYQTSEVSETSEVYFDLNNLLPTTWEKIATDSPSTQRNSKNILNHGVKVQDEIV